MTIDEYLKRVIKARYHVEKCKQRQADLYLQATSPRPASFDESGTKSSKGDVYGNALAALADAGTETAEAVLRYWNVRDEVERALFRLEDADELHVLFERYVEGRTLFDIMDGFKRISGPKSRTMAYRILNNGKAHLTEILQADGLDIDSAGS